MLVFADSANHYDSTFGSYKYDRGTPNPTTGGRRGKKCLTFGPNFGGLVRNIGDQTALIAGGAFFITESLYFPLANKWGAGAIFANSMTSNGFLFGFGYQGVAQCGAALAPDGGLHLIRGSAFDLGANSLASERVASSDPGVFRFNQWQYFELMATAAGAELRVNGVTVLDYTGSTAQNGLPTDFTQFYIHGGSAEGNGAGWSGKLCDMYLLNTAGDRNNDFLGDIAVDYLRPDGAGFVSGSTIGGTAPAPSRWQSVDDSVPDGESTYVALPTIADADSYTHEDLPYDEADVFAVQAVLVARKSDTGLAAVQHTQRVNSLDATGPSHFPAGGEFGVYLTPFDESADGPWTKAKFDDSEFGVVRVAP